MDWAQWWIHLLFAPIYLVIGTVRHEGLHALTAIRYGGTITVFEVLPHWHKGEFYFGRMFAKGTFTVGQKRSIAAAPHMFNVLLVIVAYFVLTNWCTESFHLFAAVAVNLVISPIVDTLYAVLKAVVKGTGDMAEVWSDS